MPGTLFPAEICGEKQITNTTTAAAATTVVFI